VFSICETVKMQSGSANSIEQQVLAASEWKNACERHATTAAQQMVKAYFKIPHKEKINPHESLSSFVDSFQAQFEVST